MRSLRWVLMQCDWWPYKKLRMPREDTDTWWEKSLYWWRKSWKQCGPKPWNTMFFRQPVEAAGGKKTSSQQISEDMWPCWHPNFRLPAIRQAVSAVLSPSVLLCYKSSGNIRYAPITELNPVLPNYIKALTKNILHAPNFSSCGWWTSNRDSSLHCDGLR